MDDVDGAFVLDERVARPIERIPSGRGGELGDALPRPLDVVTCPGDDDAVPGPAGLDLLAADPFAHGRILEPFAHPLGAALVHPVRDGDREAGRRGGVGILVRRHVDPFGARALDRGGRFAHLAPVALAGGLVVRELHAHARATADLDVLGDRLEEPRRLVADVARVEAALLTDDGAERGQLVRRPERARWIDEPGREADGTLVHRSAEERAHPFELGGARRPRVRAHHAGPERPMTDERAHVDRRLRTVDRRRVFAERRPGAFDVESRELSIELRLGEAAHRRGRSSAVATDDERHTHVQRALERVVHEHRLVRVRVDVDEPGRDHSARDIEHRGPVRGDVALDGDDHVAAHRDVRAALGCAGPVDDHPAAKDEIGHVRRRSRPLPRSRRFATTRSFRDEGPAGFPS